MKRFGGFCQATGNPHDRENGNPGKVARTVPAWTIARSERRGTIGPPGRIAFQAVRSGWKPNLLPNRVAGAVCCAQNECEDLAEAFQASAHQPTWDRTAI